MIKKIIKLLCILVLVFFLYRLLSTPPKSTDSNQEEYPINTIEENNSTPEFILYWGNGCPHCENVRDYINQNNLSQKLNIIEKEVYEDKTNQKELLETVEQYCPELNTGGIGVPLAFDSQSQKCLQGDTPIINFLKEKTQ